MWILVEYNPDLALRDISMYESEARLYEECVPKVLKIWEVYNFLKKWQRNYYFWDLAPIPLLKTEWNQLFSRPFASIKILEATHFLKNGEVWTKWKYKVVDVFDVNDPKIHFEWFLSAK